MKKVSLCIMRASMLLFVLALLPHTILGNEGEDFWKNFNPDKTSFDEAKQQLEGISKVPDYRTFNIIRWEKTSKIPFDKLSDQQGEKGEHWYTSGKFSVFVAPESIDFYNNTIYPKLHKFLSKIAVDVKTVTMEYTILGNNRLYLEPKDINKVLVDSSGPVFKPVFGLLRSKDTQKLQTLKLKDVISIETTFFILPSAFGNSVPQTRNDINDNVRCKYKKEIFFIPKFHNPQKEDLALMKTKKVEISDYYLTFPIYHEYDVHRNKCQFIFAPYVGFCTYSEPIILNIPDNRYSDLDDFVLAWNSKGNTSYSAVQEEEILEIEKNKILREQREAQKEKISRERSFIISIIALLIACFIIAANAYCVILTIYALKTDLHPEWYLLPRVAFKELGFVLYLGFISFLFFLFIFLVPISFFNNIFFCGVFFLPFMIKGGLLKTTEEERIRNTIQDTFDEIRNPGSSLLNGLIRWGTKIFLALLVGGILIHFLWSFRLYVLCKKIFKIKNETKQLIDAANAGDPQSMYELAIHYINNSNCKRIGELSDGLSLQSARGATGLLGNGLFLVCQGI